MKPTGPQEAELRKDFIRVQSDEDATRVLVTVITWDGPATPIGTWVEAAALPANADTGAVETEVRRIFREVTILRRTAGGRWIVPTLLPILCL